jgi:hypothetical protein
VKISFSHIKVYFCINKTYFIILKIKSMKTKKLMNLCLSLLTLAGLFLISCGKDNNVVTVQEVVRPNINRTINYTVLVVAGETAATNSTIKSAVETKGATGAVVQVSVNGSVSSKTTDISGQATFTNLVAGIAAVTVELANHTTVDYIVDLYHVDTNMYDNETKRIASTKVVVFPTSGAGMITVSGLVQIQSNIEVTFAPWANGNVPYSQSPELEKAPAGTVISAVVTNSELSKYVTMLDGVGSLKAFIPSILTDVTYEGVSFSGAVNDSGAYSINVPSTAMGLEITILPPQVATNLTYSIKQYNSIDGTFQTNSTTNNYILATKTVRYIFSASSSSVTAYTTKNVIQDIVYNNPMVNDSLYFGQSTYLPKP